MSELLLASDKMADLTALFRILSTEPNTHGQSAHGLTNVVSRLHEPRFVERLQAYPNSDALQLIQANIDSLEKIKEQVVELQRARERFFSRPAPPQVDEGDDESSGSLFDEFDEDVDSDDAAHALEFQAWYLADAVAAADAGAFEDDSSEEF